MRCDSFANWALAEASLRILCQLRRIYWGCCERYTGSSYAVFHVKVSVPCYSLVECCAKAMPWRLSGNRIWLFSDALSTRDQTYTFLSSSFKTCLSYVFLKRGECLNQIWRVNKSCIHVTRHWHSAEPLWMQSILICLWNGLSIKTGNVLMLDDTESFVLNVHHTGERSRRGVCCLLQRSLRTHFPTRYQA